MRSRNENYKAPCIPVYFRPGWRLARYGKKAKQMATIPDLSEGIVKVSA